MPSARDRLLGIGTDVASSDSYAGKVKPEENGHEEGERNRQKNHIEFIPLASNADFFDGEPRGLPYHSFNGWQRARDYSRLDLYFCLPEGHFKITVTGRNLQALMMGIRSRHTPTVEELDEMQAAGVRDGIAVTGLSVEVMERG